MNSLKWLLFGVVASVLAWRIVVLGMADNYAADIDNSNRALSWYARHPKALADQGLALMDSHPGKAEELLRRAVWENPADGRVYMGLARYWEQKGDARKAAELVEMASTLAPMRVMVQLPAAEFWLRQGQLDKALLGWSAALRLRPAISIQLYPLLLRLVENPVTLPAFKGLLDDRPEWWADFFGYLANNAIALDTVKVLYNFRGRDNLPPTEQERMAYLARLEREGQWLELYFAWLSSLEPEQMRVLGSLYDGGFELPMIGAGFGWRAPAVRGAVVETAPTYGMRGNRALHLVFQGLRVQFRHLYQYLLLAPGRYQLRGWGRPDSLQTERGVQWAITCAGAGADQLGNSERFLGTGQWRPFTVDFEVPAQGCQVQRLQLELAGRAALEFEAKGGVWFDGLGISRLK